MNCLGKWFAIAIGLLLLSGCTGQPMFTIGGTVSGLSGTGLVIQNNGGNSLKIAKDGPFTFSNGMASGAAYSVTVQTQPTNPSQTCTVANGSGKLTATVSNVTITCSATGGNGGSGGGNGGGNGSGATFTIGGNVTGLTGTKLVLQDNGADPLTINTSGPFTFATAVASGGAYNVTVLTQPTNPSQTCTVTNAIGTATANVTNVAVVCTGGTLSVNIGGFVSGLAGSGLVLQDNGGSNLTVTANGPFTFSAQVPAGSAYAVTIMTQPSNPAQTCNVTNGSGTAKVNVTNVQVVCGQPAFSISGTLIGLVDGTGNTVEVQDDAGDDLYVTGNNSTFTFPTQLTSGDLYKVSVFLQPTSQPQPCNVFNGSGVITANVSNVLVDCEHNDWAWIFGPTSGNQYAKAVFPLEIPDPNTPGGRDFGVTWTDKAGRKWLFGGFGYPLPLPGITLPTGFLNDLWVWDGVWTPANLPITVNASGTPVPDTTALTAINENGAYGTLNTPGGNPGSRWGGSTWTDGSGNLWMFGGQGYDSASIETVLLNDVWEFLPGAYDPSGTFTGNWIWRGGPQTGNQAGVYGTQGVAASTNIPGGRWAAATATDASGNVWLFGGQGYDAQGAEGLLNDLWKYQPSTGQWTWVAGSNLANQNGSYGTLGTATAGDAPGGRQAGVLWTDTSGNVWVFAGFGLDSFGTPNGTLNDLWEYQPAAGTWIWVSGGKLGNQNGAYGTQLVGSASNVPGSRWGAVGWTDPSGDLWLFGGWGYDAKAADGTGFLNDIWEYEPSKGQWIWWKGSSGVDQNGAYLSTLPYTNNVAGGRRGAARWVPDKKWGYIYIFGGQGYDAVSENGNNYLNDFWQYLPYP